MMEKKEYPIKHLVNLYFGNHCTRKCFDKEERLYDHHMKLLDFAEKNPNLKMTHADFLDLFNDEVKICTLEDSFKRKMISWKLFERLQDTPNYNSDDIIVKDNVVQTKNGLLEKPVVRCKMCKFLGIKNYEED